MHSLLWRSIACSNQGTRRDRPMFAKCHWRTPGQLLSLLAHGLYQTLQQAHRLWVSLSFAVQQFKTGVDGLSAQNVVRQSSAQCFAQWFQMWGACA